MSELTLTPGQQDAHQAFCDFIIDRAARTFVLEGYSGTGKTTLVRVLLDLLPKLLKTYKLINPTEKYDWDVLLTATTNKAAEAFSQLTGEEVRTIHSVLGLRVATNFRTGVTKLIPRSNAETPSNTILFVDEASYIDRDLLKLVFERTENCKIIFIGDPAQLSPVKSKGTPVFSAGFPTARLTEVVRQAEGNPIIELSTAFRDTVNTGQWVKFITDGDHVRFLSRPAFEQAILDEFTDPTWTYNRSKVLAWTNKAVINYNQGIRNHALGSPELKRGDYAVCNKFITAGKKTLKTDQLVRITHISEPTTELDVPGRRFELDKSIMAFMPDTRESRKTRLVRAKSEEAFHDMQIIENQWIDLRAAYACTINKSQGSTYDKVYIDFDDIKKCNSGDQIARMLYVAVSRARETVYLCGDTV